MIVALLEAGVAPAGLRVALLNGTQDARDVGHAPEHTACGRPSQLPDSRPTIAQLEQLSANLIELKTKRGLDLVVFDSLAMFLPASNENSSGAMMNALTPFLALAGAGLAVRSPKVKLSNR
jgi:hypothetical protein